MFSRNSVSCPLKDVMCRRLTNTDETDVASEDENNDDDEDDGEDAGVDREIPLRRSTRRRWE